MGPCPNHLCEDCHACPSPLASASPYPASGLPGPIRCRHRPGLATLPTHRPPSAPPLSRPTPRSRPFLSARSRPTRPRPPLLCSRFGLAATTSDLGGRLYPSTLGRQPSRHRPAQRTYPATLVSPPATTPSPGPGGADPKRTWAERPRPTIPGRWTPVSSYAWAAARVSPGCGWWTSTVALPGHHGFPTTTGPTSRRPTCSGRCGQPSHAGGCRGDCGWTTANRGAPGATCRRRWRCG